MDISTRTITIVFGLAVVALNSQGLQAQAERHLATTKARDANRTSNTLAKEQARAVKSQSQIALERAPACISVFIENKEVRFVDQTPVWVDKQPMSDGRIVCNGSDTAVVRNGKLTDIAAVTADDKPEYDRLRRGAQPTENTTTTTGTKK
jgi:hypothetical protein